MTGDVTHCVRNSRIHEAHRTSRTRAQRTAHFSARLVRQAGADGIVVCRSMVTGVWSVGRQEIGIVKWNVLLHGDARLAVLPLGHPTDVTSSRCPARRAP